MARVGPTALTKFGEGLNRTIKSSRQSLHPTRRLPIVFVAMFGFGKGKRSVPARGPGHRHASAEQRQEIYKRDGGRCVYCGVRLTRSAFHSDHVVAYSKRGGTVVANLAVSCGPCNMAKQAMSAESFQRVIKKQGLKARDQMAARHMTASAAHQHSRGKKGRVGKQVGRAIRRQAVRSAFKLF
jgi:hypothetical protein